MSNKSEAYGIILDYVNSLEIIDTHEHLPGREEYIDKNTDILKEYLIHYFSVDLISSGLSRDDFATVTDASKPLLERWRLVEKYWEYARHTGYGRAIDHTVQGLYGIDRLDGSTIEKANELFLKARSENPYQRVLKEKCKIHTCLADNGDLESDRTYFTPVYQLNNLIVIHNIGQVQELSRQSGIAVTCFDDWLDMAEALVIKAINKGVTVFKISLAYERPIRFIKVDYAQAEAAFNKIFNHFHQPEWVVEELTVSRLFQDYMLHYLLRIINKHGLTVQFHTGILEGNGNVLENSNPTLLNNLFLTYNNIRFDLFHISYPYQREAIALCKMFPNVYLDMCWAHIISPNSSMEFLREYLDAVAVNKLSAFGGDYCMVDTVYGHQLMARRNVSRVLAEKVEDNIFSIERACEIAKLIFFDNPVEIFSLDISR
jgi:predicted TIM-barrel fold metal-dependent hydrolase